MATHFSAINDKWVRLRRAAHRSWVDFEEWMGKTVCTTAQRTGDAWRQWRCSPRVDLFDTNDAVELRVDLPGVPADAIDIKVHGRRVTITGQRPTDCRQGGRCSVHERATGEITRSVTVPCSIRDDQIDARYRDGVLLISLPKKQRETHIHVRRETGSSESRGQSHETIQAI